jgi:hypothetical protein
MIKLIKQIFQSHSYGQALGSKGSSGPITCNTLGLLCCQNFAQNQAGNTKKLSQAVVISISGSGRQVTSGFYGTSLQLLKLLANQEQLQGIWRRKAVPNFHLMNTDLWVL